MKYEDSFTSTLKRLGFVAKIFSQTKVRRLRELNCALAKKTGHKISVKNLEDKKGKRNIVCFDANTMLTRDKKNVEDDAKALCVKDIKHKCGEGANLYAQEGKTLNADCWEHAKKLFQEDPDYSAVIGLNKKANTLDDDEMASDNDEEVSKESEI